MAAYRCLIPKRSKSVLPGFGLTMGFTILYLSLVVLIPLSSVLIKTAGMTWEDFFAAAFSPRTMAAYRLSFGGALLAALINGVFGFVVAWVLVRYRFPGRKLLDAMVDLPFALPTAVAGIALVALYDKNGWVGAPLAAMGLQVAYRPLGVLVAMVFIGLPFVVRMVEPVVQDLDRDVEEAAISLGASRWHIFSRIVLPTTFPALLTGFSLAFSRAVGEYGSIIFIAGNFPHISEIAPLLIVVKLEQFDTAGATAIATVMLVVSFFILLLVNMVQRWRCRREGEGR